MPKYAFIMPYEDEQGNLYPASYWTITHQAVDYHAQVATCTFTGWRNEQAYLDHKRSRLPKVSPEDVLPITSKNVPILGAVKRYDTVGPESFWRFINWYESQNPMLHVYAVCQLQALSVKDVGEAPVGDAEDTRVSFFKDATIA